MRKLSYILISLLYSLIAFPQSKGALIGNSTVASITVSGVTYNSIGYYLLNSCNLQQGNTCNVLAIPGATIAGQQQTWAADPQKAMYDWITIEIGLNDVWNSNDLLTTINQYQWLVNYINNTKKSGAKVVVLTLTPCREYLFANYPTATAQQYFTKWQGMNAAIMGFGQNSIYGVDGRVMSHTIELSDSNGNLLSQYDIGDHLHENNAARQLIATKYKSALQSLGFLNYTIGIPK